MKFRYTDKFKTDLKYLKKKFLSIENDLEILKEYGIPLFHEGKKTIDSVQVPGFCNNKFITYKVRTIACKSLKNKGKQSGLRLIYVYEQDTNQVTFLEIYFKGNKENEDKSRITTFMKDNST